MVGRSRARRSRYEKHPRVVTTSSTERCDTAALVPCSSQNVASALRFSPLREDRRARRLVEHGVHIRLDGGIEAQGLRGDEEMRQMCATRAPSARRASAPARLAFSPRPFSPPLPSDEPHHRPFVVLPSAQRRARALRRVRAGARLRRLLVQALAHGGSDVRQDRARSRSPSTSPTARPRPGRSPAARRAKTARRGALGDRNARA